MGLFSPIVEPSGLRNQFPVLARLAYLNAGTDGPLSARAAGAARAELERELAEGRATAHFERRGELGKALRGAYARALRCEPAELSLTTCTTEGMAQVVMGLDLAPGDELLTSDEEHPGLLGALAAARDIRGVTVREVPLARIAEEVGPATRLVACSHVGWVSGSLAPAELAELDVPVLLDGAQGVGAIDVDVTSARLRRLRRRRAEVALRPRRLGCRCGSRPALREQLAVSRRGYGNLEEANGARRAVQSRTAAASTRRRCSAESLACLARRRGGARGVRLGGGLGARCIAGRAAGARCSPSAAAQPAPRGREHARLLPQRGPAGRARAARLAGGDRAQHPRPALAAGLRRARGTTRATSSGWSGRSSP